MSDSPEKESPVGLVRKDDPNTLKAIRLREIVCDDPELSDGAVRLFVRLLDLALNPWNNNNRKGSIIISQMKLGCTIHCDERSIRRRTDELIRANHVWTSLVARQNTKPILCYHITDFDPKRQVEQMMPGEGLWGNGKRRYDHGFTRTGKDAAGHQRRMPSVLFDRFGKQLSFNCLENEPARGRESPATPDKNDRSDRTLASSGNGQNCPVTEDASVLSQRSKLSAASGQNCPLTKDASVRHKESPVGERANTGVKGEPLTPSQVAFLASIKGEYRSRLEKLKRDLEGSFRRANTPKAKADWRWRIEAVDIEMLGGPVADEPHKSRPVRKAPEPVAELTQEQLLESARAAVELGVTLTQGQRRALEWAGKNLPAGMTQPANKER